VVTHLLAAWDFALACRAAPTYHACMYGQHILHLGAWLPVIIVVAVLIFAFEIWMIVDAAVNRQMSDRARVWWIIGMLIIHPVVAIVYFFTDHRKRARA
jgi:hypothetical protein